MSEQEFVKVPVVLIQKILKFANDHWHGFEGETELLDILNGVKAEDRAKFEEIMQKLDYPVTRDCEDQSLYAYEETITAWKIFNQLNV